MLRETIHKVEVEVAQELWAVVLYDQDDSHGGLVELSQRLGHGLSHYHVALKEEEKVHDELLKLKPLLEIVIVLLLLRNLKLCLDCSPFFVSLS